MLQRSIEPQKHCGPQPRRDSASFRWGGEQMNYLLDDIVEGLPIWPWMETTITPLTSFDGRMAALRPRLERLKARLHQEAAV